MCGEHRRPNRGRTGPRRPICIRPWGSFWPDSDNVADKELEDHAEAERTMKELESLDADEPGSDLLIGELVTGIRSHIRDEEDYLFPRLRQTASEDARMKVGDQVRRGKKTAPTRPHPSAPNHPAPPGIPRWWAGLWPALGRHGNGLSGPDGVGWRM
jgi:hypothetical protein